MGRLEGGKKLGYLSVGGGRGCNEEVEKGNLLTRI